MNNTPIEWLDHLPDVVVFIIGLGALAGAILLILKLWRAVVPNDTTRLARDVETLKSDVKAVHDRVTKVEVDVARIDYAGVISRFDAIDRKLDGLFSFLLERFSGDGVKPPRPRE